MAQNHENNQSFIIAAAIAVLLSAVFLFNCFYLRSGNDETIKFSGKVNINTAQEGALTLIEGVGPVKAQKIIEYRNKNAGFVFRDCNDLQKVSGIGPKTAESIKEYVEFN